VQDIAQFFQPDHGVDLEARFCASTVPVIVKFAADNQWDGVAPSALWYACCGCATGS
jgi:hypothetical protein